ncbi:MAG: homocysteine S-methyltransferase family protein, partial [Clostridia bacterium]|nr:homocysteine S-methyltransferase family protein [Clostridia bacterium]
MNILDYLKKHIVLLDGGMGTLLQEKGLAPGEIPERWNVTHPEVVTEIHRAYYDAGSQIVNTNTFGANSLHFSHEELKKVVRAAIRNADHARQTSRAAGEKFIALDIGPTGRLLKPLGDLDFEDAVEVFAKTIRIGVDCGVDLVMIETMNDSYETKAALLAAKENTDLPVFVSNAYGENGKLMTGADPAVMVAMLEGMGADVIGINCSFGPDKLADVAREYLRIASVPVLLKPNAGMPRSENGKTVYDIAPPAFAKTVSQLIREGVRVAGGCCGTTPAYIAALKESIKGLDPVPVSIKNRTVVTSYAKAVVFDENPVLIGERINPTGKKKFKQALRDHDIGYLLNEGIRQQEAGAVVLDVNVGLPEIDEASVLEETVCALQTVTDLPLQIDTSSPAAMERALRRYNGKALVNSVTGKQESMETVFPLVKKYGGTVIALTLDEYGIPDTAQGRVKIAENIILTAARYGIEPKDLVFDTLVMAVSAEPHAAEVTLEAMRIIRHHLQVHTSLGVSNVSFGLPAREAVNAVFFAAALQSGLSAAIMNPFSEGMMKTYYAYRVLKGLDENCADYLAYAERFDTSAEQKTVPSVSGTLADAIQKGLKEQAAVLTADMLKTQEAMTVVNESIIPSLDTVGRLYEECRAYLPKILMSAEAAKAAFEVIKQKMSTRSDQEEKCRFVIATVKGDIHDLGKNIVKLLLENYGFAVTDLGKDVPPETVAETVKRL